MRAPNRPLQLGAATLVVLTAGAAGLPMASGVVTARASTRHVLLVGSYRGHKGKFKTIQAAVDAAKPHDVILVGPGDYHERGDYTTHPPQNGRGSAGVYITTPHLTIRGMNRNRVIVDGTKRGASPCSRAATAQDYGPRNSAKKHLGRNGVEVWKATDVTIENMTVCNFMDGVGNDGNQIWWNGGDDSGKVGGHGAFYGAYLTATSTFFKTEDKAAQYGIFSSNWASGGARAEWNHTYASNFNDSGYYIGACRQVCGQVVNHAWAEYNALGYSGSNSGGSLIIENSEFDHNTDGFDTNSQNGDNPPPQDGACTSGKSPITKTTSCWVFIHNYVHDNNNPNVPSAGTASEGPVGTGVSISGGRNDTIMNNRFVNNGAWGVILVPFPDSGPPCTGGDDISPDLCLYDEWGDAINNNTFSNNGGFGNPTNGDIAELQFLPNSVNNCMAGNKDTSGTLTVSPTGADSLHPTCDGQPNGGTTSNDQFLSEVACDSGADVGPVNGQSACSPTDNYPRRTKVVMHKLPAHLRSMPNPCRGVPANPWCPTSGSSAVVSSARSLTSLTAAFAVSVRREAQWWTSSPMS